MTLPMDFRRNEEEEGVEDGSDDGDGEDFPTLDLAPTFTVGTRSFARSWAWRASLARRYLRGEGLVGS